MQSTVRYFRSQNYSPPEEMSAAQAQKKGTYVRAEFHGDRPHRAEVFINGQARSVVYYDVDSDGSEIIRNHLEEYGPVPATVYAPPRVTDEGELHILSSWSSQGKLLQINNRLVDARGEAIREALINPDGSPLGIRRFEYENGLIRVIFTEPDGTEIVEFEER